MYRQAVVTLIVFILAVSPMPAVAASSDSSAQQLLQTKMLDGLAGVLRSLASLFASPITLTPQQVAAGGSLNFSGIGRIDSLSSTAIQNPAITGGSISGASIVSLGSALSIANGGTGAVTANAARLNLGLLYAATSDIDSNSTIATWGDSLTAGAGGGGTTYETVLSSLSGYTVNNGGVGGETSTQIKTRMLAATDKSSWPTIIWAGRNNYSDPITVKADIAAMIAALGSNQNYLVLSVLNGDYGAYEYSGGAGYNQIKGINNDLAATYGSHFVDVRSFLISRYDSNSSQDVIDHGHDIPPSSLRADSIHLNAAGYTAVAQKVFQSISALQNNATVLTSANAPYLSKTFNGGSSSNGRFNQLSIGTSTISNALELSGSMRITNGNLIVQNDSGVIQLKRTDGTGSATIEVSGNGNYVQMFGSGLVPRIDDTTVIGVGPSGQRFRAMYLGTGASTIAGSLSIGTTTLAPTNGSAVAGNVGIGTTSPSGLLAKMEVVGNLLVTNSNGGILFRKSDTTGGNSLVLAGDGSTLQIGGSFVPYPDNTYALGIASQRWGSLNIGAGSATFGGTGTFAGSLGVGTTSVAGYKAVITGGNVLLQQDNGTISFKTSAGAGSAGLQVSGNGNYVQAIGSGFLPQTDDAEVLGFTASLQRWREIHLGSGTSTTAGALGLGTSSPWRMLSVTGTVSFDGLTGATGAGSLCLTTNREVVYNSGSDSCLPSLRALKHEIAPLPIDAVAQIKALQPVSFIYNDDASSTVRYGFIAEDTANVDAHLATYNQAGSISGVDDRALLSVVVSALQKLMDQVADFADRFATKELTFTRATGGEVDIQRLCIGSTCVNEDQLKALLNQAGQQSAPSIDVLPHVEAPSVVPDENTSSSTTTEEAATTAQ